METVKLVLYVAEINRKSFTALIGSQYWKNRFIKKNQKEMYVDRVEGYFVSPSFSFSIQSSSPVSCFLFFFMALYPPKALLEKI